MAAEEQPQGRMRQVLGQVAPGLEALSRYQVSWLPSDIAAGVSVAAVALPVGIAYADLAHVPPVMGIYAAIFPPLAYALFGSSRQLMIGPDAATRIMLAAALAPLAGGDAEHYRALVIVMTLMVGVIYLLMGAARLGFIASFLSRPILVGYLNGIALLIIVGQLGKLLGISVVAGDFFPRLLETLARIDDVHLPTVALGLTLLIGLIALRRFAPRVPAAFVVVDASPINVIDSTALKQLEQLIEALEARGILFAIARRKHAVRRLFEASWADVRRELADEHNHPTLTSAVDAFHARGRGDREGQVPQTTQG